MPPFGRMRNGATHYTAASGIREVREKTAAYVTRHTGVPTEFENIVLTPGSKNLLLFALLSLVEEGDEVIVPDPGYPIYRSLAEFIGAKAVSLPLRQENDFRADVDELARSSRRAPGCWWSTRRRTRPAASSPGRTARRSRASPSSTT